MNTKHIEALKLARESLKELVADPQIGFAPAYEGAKQRQKKSITAVGEALTEMQRLYEVEKEYRLFLATIKTQIEQLPQRSHT